MASVDGLVLKRHREDPMDLSQDEAAALLQISTGYLRNIENGIDSNKLSRRLVGRIARVYRLDLADFVLEDDKSDGKDDEKKDDSPDTSHPTRRQEKEKSTGPKRVVDEASDRAAVA